MNLDNITNIGDSIDRSLDLDRIAIIDLKKSSPDHISYRDLDKLSNAVARGLADNNISQRDKVAVLATNSIEYVATFFGILRLGAIPVLINVKLPNNQINQILIESGSRLLFSDVNFESDIKTIKFNDDFRLFCNFGDFEIYQPTSDDIAFLFYTSGTYNSPKAVAVLHSGHSWFLDQGKKGYWNDPWTKNGISLICAPLYHANGLTCLETNISIGFTIVLLPQFDPIKCIKAIEEYKIKIFYAVPTMLAIMLQEKETFKKIDVSSLKVISMASSHLSKELAKKIQQAFPTTKIYNNYGTTEIGGGLFGFNLELADLTYRPLGSVGYPRVGIQYRIVDGILQIKSPTMITSYYKNNTSDHLTEDGFFITNDLFEIDENGYYYFIGRADDVFKCGGNKVNPREVEQLLESHPAVSASAVIGLDDDIKGKKPYAFVVLEKNKTASQEELIEHSLNNGPAYQHPRRIWFLDALPLAGTNKVDKKYLEDLATQLTNQK